MFPSPLLPGIIPWHRVVSVHAISPIMVSLVGMVQQKNYRIHLTIFWTVPNDDDDHRTVLHNVAVLDVVVVVHS